jgi:hypothetical protein
MHKGMMGFKLHKDEAKDQFAFVNMRERCSLKSDKMKPFMVIKDFKFSQFTWVFPWSFNKKEIPNPTRSVLVSRIFGVSFKKL